jgi:hypothetical protein
MSATKLRWRRDSKATAQPRAGVRVKVANKEAEVSMPTERFSPQEEQQGQPT